MIFRNLVYKLMRRWADWDATVEAYVTITGQEPDPTNPYWGEAMYFEASGIIEACWPGLLWNLKPVKVENDIKSGDSTT